MSGNSEYLVATLKDGDCIVEYEVEALIGTMTFVEIEMPVVVEINKVIEIHVTSSSPATTITEEPQMIQVSGNVVGFTIGAAAGSTVGINCCVIGF